MAVQLSACMPSHAFVSLHFSAGDFCLGRRRRWNREERRIYHLAYLGRSFSWVGCCADHMTPRINTTAQGQYG